MELDENPWQALAHELLEESGYELEQMKLLQPRKRIKHLTGSLLMPVPVCINTHPFHDNTHFHIDIEYALVTDQKPKHPVADDESREFACFSRREILKLPVDKLHEDSRQVIMFIFDTCLPEWEQVSVD